MHPHLTNDVAQRVVQPNFPLSSLVTQLASINGYPELERTGWLEMGDYALFDCFSDQDVEYQLNNENSF
jgi:hypothetical protein